MARPRTRSQTASNVSDENPITAAKPRGIVKLCPGRTRIVQGQNVPHEMTVTPSKPPGKENGAKRSSKRKLEETMEEEKASPSQQCRQLAEAAWEVPCAAIRTHCSGLVDSVRKDSESPKARTETGQDEPVDPSRSTPHSRSATLLAQLLSPVRNFFGKEWTNGANASKESTGVERKRGRSRSYSKTPASPEELPDCNVSTLPVSQEELRPSRRGSPDLAETDSSLGEELDSNEEEETVVGILQERAAEPATVLVTEEEDRGEEEEEEAEELEETEEDLVYYEPDPYEFIKSLPPLESCADPWRRCILPKQTTKRKTLVLDLDETLIHTELWEESSPNCWFKMIINDGVKYVHVGKRPHLDDFLKRCSAIFEVVIFTASLKHYANAVVDRIDPDRTNIQHRLFRDSCLFVCKNYVKDISILGRDLSQTIIVDNSPQAFGFQVSNGIPIESWYNDPDDNELLKLFPILEALAAVQDVRPVINSVYKVQEKVDAVQSYNMFEEYSE